MVIATATGSWEEGPEGPPRRRKRGVGKLNGPEQWQPLPVGPQPDLVLSRAGAGQEGRWPAGGLGLHTFVPKVPRRRDHWPFLAWALRASGNSSRTIISGGMCYSPSSQKARLGPIRSAMSVSGLPELQGILGSPGGHSGLQSWGGWEARMGSSRRKAPSPCWEGWFCPQILGSQGPAWSQAWSAGVQLTPSPGTQEQEGRGGRGGELPAPPPAWTHA